jgi:hypothetical protein
MGCFTLDLCLTLEQVLVASLMNDCLDSSSNAFLATDIVAPSFLGLDPEVVDFLEEVRIDLL